MTCYVLYDAETNEPLDDGEMSFSTLKQAQEERRKRANLVGCSIKDIFINKEPGEPFI